jgi:phage tail sheath protein FI
MGFLVSPGVEVNEIDMTNIIPALSTSIGAYAGEFNWGPSGRIVTVSSEAELASTFGAPSVSGTNAAASSRSFFTAASFLKYGNTLRVSRAVPNTAVNAYSGLTGIGIITDVDDFETTSNKPAGAYARYAGSIANGLKVVVVTENNDGDSYYGTGSGSTVSEYVSQLSYLPGTTEWAAALTDDEYIYDECAVLVIDVEGKFGSTRGAVLERFEGLSLAKNAKTVDGANNYFIDVVNAQSQYVYAYNLETKFLTATAPVELTTASTSAQFTYKTSGAEFTFTLASGADGTVTTGDITAALELFAEGDATDINFIFAETLSDSRVTQKVIDDKLIGIANDRKDVITFISAPLIIATTGLSGTTDTKTGTVTEYFENLSSTSYAMFGSTPVQMYNKYTDRFIWVPDSGHLAGLCAYTDDATEPWFSPAGLNRGQLRGVSKLALNPNKTQRDDLYKSRVNPIVSFPGEGIVLYGDKTALSRPSAFDRINVRRLFITLEKAIATFAKYQLFELNDEFTRAAFRAAVEPYLRIVQARRGITDFRVICDTTNNTGAVIDANGFVADIYIKPARSINFITLNFIATRTGVEFKEIVGG